jgi:hypothetical protein
VFVASRVPYDLSVLSSAVLDHQEALPIAARIEVEVRDAALADMRLQLERAQDRAALLEKAAAERLALIEEQQRRAAVLESAASDRLTIIENLKAEIHALQRASGR